MSLAERDAGAEPGAARGRDEARGAGADGEEIVRADGRRVGPAGRVDLRDEPPILLVVGEDEWGHLARAQPILEISRTYPGRDVQRPSHACVFGKALRSIPMSVAHERTAETFRSATVNSLPASQSPFS